VFGNLNMWEILGLALIALFIFGPERLPKVVGDAMRMLRGLRNMARNATNDLSRELGTEVRLEDLNPKTFIRRHVLSDEEQAALRRPIDDLAHDVRGIERSVSGPSQRAGEERTPGAGTGESDVRRAGAKPEDGDGVGRHRTDPDAT
jgi:sec-independent protein translocase protein TatB